MLSSTQSLLHLGSSESLWLVDFGFRRARSLRSPHVCKEENAGHRPCRYLEDAHMMNNPLSGCASGITTARVRVVQLFPFNLHPGLSHFDCGRLHQPRDLPGALVLRVENLDVDMPDVATDVATNVEVPTPSVDDTSVVSNNLVGDEDVPGAPNVTDDNNPTAQPPAVVAIPLDLFAPARSSHTHLPHGRISSTSSTSHSSQQLSIRSRRYHHCCQTQQRPSSAARKI